MSLLEKVLGASSQAKFFVDFLIQFGPFRLEFGATCGRSRIRALEKDKQKKRKVSLVFFFFFRNI